MKKILFTIAAVSLITFGACKKDEDKDDKKDDTTFVAPTLIKTNLYDKVWQDKSGTVDLNCKTGGVHGLSGTWEWLNDSDSMDVKPNSGASTKTWYFKYCQGDSLEARIGSKGSFFKMKDHVW